MFYDNFVRLCKERDVSRTKACIDCGLSRTTWHKWENGGVPNGSTLNKFAEYFGKNIDNLIGNTDKAKNTTEDSGGFSEKDKRLVAWFNSLPEEKQKAILSLGGAPEDLAE